MTVFLRARNFVTICFHFRAATTIEAEDRYGGSTSGCTRAGSNTG